MPETAPTPALAPRSWLLWAIAVAGLAVLIGSLVLSLASARLQLPVPRAVLIGWIVVPYVISGLIAWWRRPANRLGPLMLLTGFVMALTPLQWSSQPVAYSIGHVFDMLPAAMFLHVFLAFPGGRLARRGERVLVLGCYGIVLGLQLIKIVLGASPDSVFTVTARPELGNRVEGLQLSLVAGCLIAGTVVLFRRRPGRRSRRPATLVVDVFGFALIMLALLYVAGLFGWPFLEPLRLATFAALGLAPIAFLVGLLDLRLARGDVAGLLVELRADPTTDLQAPLARALRDPSLRLAYWLGEFGSWADQHGEPTTAPTADERRAVRILSRDDEPMAALVFDRSLEDEHELLDAVLATAGIALENGRLRAELRARLQELQGSRVRVLEAGRQERQRLERDLHDGAQVRLVALSLELGLLGADPDVDPELKDRLRSLKEEVALESLAARAAVPIELTVELDERPPEAVEAAAYYVVSEALANIGKHAAATAATVRVRRSGSQLTVEIIDDGHGPEGPMEGSGVRGLADRVEALGGRFTVRSLAGGGVCVSAEIPCP